MFTELDIFFMQKALEQAKQAYLKDEVPVGAVLVLNNNIICQTHNSVELLNDATAHAEMIALTSAMGHLKQKYLTEATLYCTLEPCLMCAGALYWSKIKKIVYACGDEKNGASKFVIAPQSPYHPKTQILTGLFENESKNLLQSFFKSKRK